MPISRRRLAVSPWQVVLLASAALACEGNGVAAPTPATNAAELYWALTLNHHAVTLSTAAPYDTLTLVATPRRGDGTPLTGLPAPTFESTDRTRVQVTPEGVIQAVAPGDGIQLIARLSANNQTYADTTFVNVGANPTPPVLASLSAHPEPPDSAKFAIGGTLFEPSKLLPVRAFDTEGNAVSGLSVYFATSDSTVAHINRSTGMITAYRPGLVTFYASTTAFGVTKADTLAYRIGWPLVRFFGVIRLDDSAPDASARLSLDNSEFKVGVGASVLWSNFSGVPTDFTFDDPTQVAADSTLCAVFGMPSCNAGNVEPLGGEAGPFRVRRFPVPGTYVFRNTLHGIVGRIIVIDDSETASAKTSR